MQNKHIKYIFTKASFKKAWESAKNCFFNVLNGFLNALNNFIIFGIGNFI